MNLGLNLTEDDDMESNISILQRTVLERKIFRAYDIRGNVNILTPELIQKIGWALGATIQKTGKQQVVVGYDARLSSVGYAEIMATSLAEIGLQVITIGCVSSPVLYFTALQYDGHGVMLTASHNAVTDNGVKWLINGLPPTPEEIQQIADDTDQLHELVKTVLAPITIDPLPQYFAYLAQDIQLKKKFKISVEGLHGSAGAIAVQALQQLGCHVNALHCQANGNFPLGAPDPSDSRRLENLKASVLANQSDLGIALDGDGDRLVVLDAQGKLISADRLLGLFAKICLSQHPQKDIVCDVKCSSLVGAKTRQYEGHLKMIRTGSSFLRNYLASSNGQAIFGGEFAGHYVFNDGRGKGFDDGLYAALRILEYLSQCHLSLSQVLQEFPERVATSDIYIQCLGIEYQDIATIIEENTPEHAQILKVDGLRLDFPFGFGIIRPSNTGEYFTVRFDADDEIHFEYIRQLFVTSLSINYPAIAQAIADAH